MAGRAATGSFRARSARATSRARSDGGRRAHPARSSIAGTGRQASRAAMTPWSFSGGQSAASVGAFTAWPCKAAPMTASAIMATTSKPNAAGRMARVPPAGASRLLIASPPDSRSRVPIPSRVPNPESRSRVRVPSPDASPPGTAAIRATYSSNFAEVVEPGQVLLERVERGGLRRLVRAGRLEPGADFAKRLLLDPVAVGVALGHR